MSAPIDADGEASHGMSGDSPLQRVQLAGAALRGFTSLSFDDHVKVFLQQPARGPGPGRLATRCRPSLGASRSCLPAPR